MSFWTRTFRCGSCRAFYRPAFPFRGLFILALLSAGWPSGAFMGSCPRGSPARLAPGSREEYVYLAYLYIPLLLCMHLYTYTLIHRTLVSMYLCFGVSVRTYVFTHVFTLVYLCILCIRNMHIFQCTFTYTKKRRKAEDLRRGGVEGQRDPFTRPAQASAWQ